MTITLLTKEDLLRLEKSSLVEFILEGVRELEVELKKNKLTWGDPRLLAEQKVRLRNLIMMLNLLAKENPYDPLTGKVLFEGEELLSLIENLQTKTAFLTLLKKEKEVQHFNAMLDLIIKHMEHWRTSILPRLIIPPGNKHTFDCYHPEFSKTYPFKPAVLPDDYRSNFFFEVKIKELCPVTTMISFHPFTDWQSEFQDPRSLAELTQINLNLKIQDREAHEEADNLRALRVHGPGENKKRPGSYLVIKGGHHRMRALLMKYIQNEVDGDLKVLVQLVPESHFPLSKGDFWKWVSKEIEKRNVIRKRYS